MICFIEKIGMLDKLHPGMSYTAVGCEFSVNELTIYIQYGVFNHQCTLNKVTIVWLTKML